MSRVVWPINLLYQRALCALECGRRARKLEKLAHNGASTLFLLRF